MFLNMQVKYVQVESLTVTLNELVLQVSIIIIKKNIIKYKPKYLNNIINLPQKLIYRHQLMFRIPAFYLGFWWYGEFLC